MNYELAQLTNVVQRAPQRHSSYDYPDPMNLAPVVSAPNYAAPSPYYAAPPPTSLDHRHSPQHYPSYESHLQPPLPTSSPYTAISTPASIPTASSGSTRSGMNVRDMLNPGDQGGRSSTDSDMLNALNRRGLSQ